MADDDDHIKNLAKGLRISDYVVDEMVAIDDISYDPQRQMVTMSDGIKMTREEYELRVRGIAPAQGPAPLPRNIQAGGRRAGASSRAFERDLEQFKMAHRDRADVDKAHLAYILKQVDGILIVAWVSNGRYTYVAVNVGDWYISGKGDWYGKNQFTTEEFIDDVVTHPEVTAIRLVTATELLWQR